MQLGPRQIEIIHHRLEVPDALSEALAEDGFTRDEVYKACDNLIKSGPQIWTESLSKVEEAVLHDACNGSVFMACVEAEYGSESKEYRAYSRSCDLLEKRLPVSIPRM